MQQPQLEKILKQQTNKKVKEVKKDDTFMKALNN